MYLIFDTETTGLPKPELPSDDPLQAHICQLACMMLDENFGVSGLYYSLIRPKGWTVSPEAQAKNGISTEMCARYGIPVEIALLVFQSFYNFAKVTVAHNIDFDSKLINIDNECSFQKASPFIFGPHNSFCTMKGTTDLCKISNPKYPNGKYKWPKLTEAHQILLGEGFDGAHDALADVRATGRIFKHLIQNQIVHFV